jgi:hypothetical protein
MMAAGALPAQAQMEDGELPEIDFSVNMMQSAQYVSLDAVDDDADPNAISGFHRARAGLNASVQFSENVSGLVMLEQEPNDFGGGFGLGPSVDFMVMNLQVSEGLTVQAGTPVTGLINFRGFSDGPAVQGNPLILNSPADMITAGEGVKLIGSYDNFGFDLTVNRVFGEDLTNVTGSNSGANIIGNVRFTGSEVFQVGGGIAFATANSGLVFANGDRENINLDAGQQNGGNADQAKDSHAAIPGGGFIGQVDAKVTSGSLGADLWAGYASDSDASGEPASAFGGIGAKFDVSEDFYLAGRFTVVSDQSDGIDDADSLTRIQGGIGWMVYDKALLKVEGFTQSYGDGTAGPAATPNPNVPIDGFSGIMTELSFNF